MREDSVLPQQVVRVVHVGVRDLLAVGTWGEDVLKERLCVRDLAHVLRYVCLDSQARVCSRKCAERLQEIWSTTDGEAGCEDRLDESRVWVCG